MLGIIGGTALLQARLPPLEQKILATPFGPAEIYTGDIAILKRHQHNTPPHRINHRANLAACKIAGVDRLILIGSVGSMKEKIAPGSILLATGFFSPWNIPTLHDHDVCHVPPAIDAALTDKLAGLIPEAKKGVYFQTRGPRFETRSEIAKFADVADVVGMTAASEITLANELGIPTAVLCTVDNYANGIGGAAAPAYDEIIAIAKQNGDTVTNLITKIVETFA
ncbi:MAG: MTAP family purine nucleoside phosphorylase [Methanocorpusculum sp.]|nr:MTAP family purine nucleoside phosphorylase [Methanocorpusculum sp.]